jgi:hypothetical protein
VSAALLGCSTPLAPVELRDLVRAEARWAARPFADYSFETRSACFCPPPATQWARVEVRHGIVARVVIVESGADVAPEQLAWFPTIEELFESIRSFRETSGVKDVDAEYDPDLGYPTLVDVIPAENIADGGLTRFARNAAPLP